MHKPGHIAVGRERVEVDIGSQLLGSLDTIVDPLLVTDLTTMVWAPHGHQEGVDALRRLANILLIDTQDEPEPRLAFERAADLTRSAYVVDLAWLRSTPWRERVAATFDPPAMRSALHAIDKVVVRHRARLHRGRRALLRLAQHAARLAAGGARAARASALTGHARARRGEVTLELRPEAMGSPGLGGVTITTASGDSVSLDRGPGGLRAVRRAARRRGAGLDGDGRVARRGGHPRRGRAPGAAARPDVQARARGG